MWFVSVKSAHRCSAEGAITPAVPLIVLLHMIPPLKRIKHIRGEFLIYLNVSDTPAFTAEIK